jgi:glycosyltransferase involved in cell wall biosynthesis
MVGGGDGKAQLEREAERKAPGLVHFLGHRQDARELARLMQCCDAFVHPNPTEPFGIAPLEAMAAGVPLVAPNTGGVVTYANSENAWLAPATPEAFAAAIRTAFADPAERLRRRDAAQRTAAQSAWPLAAKQYLRLYGELHARVSRAGGYSLDPAFFSKRSFTE